MGGGVASDRGFWGAQVVRFGFCILAVSFFSFP